MITRTIALCVAAAMICSALRLQHPEIATAVSLAAGLTALALVLSEINNSQDWLDSLRDALPMDGSITADNVARLAELQAQMPDASVAAMDPAAFSSYYIENISSS